MNLEAHALKLDNILPDRRTERWFRAVAEETGEVIGAFNKMDYTGSKHRTEADVLEEMGQLLGCMIICAQRLGYSWEDLQKSADEFMQHKAEEILLRRKGLLP